MRGDRLLRMWRGLNPEPRKEHSYKAKQQQHRRTEGALTVCKAPDGNGPIYIQEEEFRIEEL